MSIVGKWMIKKDWDSGGEPQVYKFKGTARAGKIFILLKKPVEIGTYEVTKKQVQMKTKIGCDFTYDGAMGNDIIVARVHVHVHGEGFYRGDAILRRIKNG